MHNELYACFQLESVLVQGRYYDFIATTFEQSNKHVVGLRECFVFCLKLIEGMVLQGRSAVITHMAYVNSCRSSTIPNSSLRALSPQSFLQLFDNDELRPVIGM